MKITFLVLALLCSSFTYAQNRGGSSLPNVNLQTLDGRVVNASALSNYGRPFIINIWATWCSPCKRALNNIHNVYSEWLKQNGVKLIAISVDDARNKHKVVPYVRNKAWQYECYIDENQSFKRTMGVIDPPNTLVFDGNGKLVWQHSGYLEGDEDELIEIVYNLLK